MSRTTRYKLVFAGVIVVGSAALAVGWLVFDPPWQVVLLVVALLLMPGWIQRFCWRDFYRGQTHARYGNHLAAIVHFERFLQQLRERPGIKRAIWLSGFVHTADVEAMTLNNLGAAWLKLGHFELAEPSLREALRRDPEYALPWYNLGHMTLCRGERDYAAELFVMARQLGYRRAPERHAPRAIPPTFSSANTTFPPPGHCAYCGYDLSGNTSGRCPECGQSLRPYGAQE